MNKSWKKHIIGCAAGNVLELYDYIIYGFFASTLANLFFPAHGKYTSLMLAFAVFSTGSLVRPFSAIIFGYIGDKFGRKISLICAIGIMAISTFSIGLLPSYSDIGITAAILLTLCRICQGLSITSEEMGASLFLMENAPNSQKGFAGSIVLSAGNFGLLLGSVVATIIFATFSNDSLLNWGWRVPFLLGGLAGFIILAMRIQQPESDEFKKAREERQLSHNPLLDLFKGNLFSVIRTTLLFSLMGTGIYLIAIFIPNTLNIQALGTTSQTIMLMTSISLVVTVLVSLAVGKLTDRINPSIFLFATCIGFIVLSYPLFALISSKSLLLVMISYMAFSVLIAIMTGSIIIPAMRPFPPSVRFSGSCLAFNLAMSLFGGIAPVTALYLIKITHSTNSPAFMLILAAGISLIALLLEKNYESCKNPSATPHIMRTAIGKISSLKS